MPLCVYIVLYFILRQRKLEIIIIIIIIIIIRIIRTYNNNNNNNNTIIDLCPLSLTDITYTLFWQHFFYTIPKTCLFQAKSLDKVIPSNFPYVRLFRHDYHQ